MAHWDQNKAALFRGSEQYQCSPGTSWVNADADSAEATTSAVFCSSRCLCAPSGCLENQSRDHVGLRNE
jgi:hypothetical protein